MSDAWPMISVITVTVYLRLKRHAQLRRRMDASVRMDTEITNSIPLAFLFSITVQLSW